VGVDGWYGSDGISYMSLVSFVTHVLIMVGGGFCVCADLVDITQTNLALHLTAADGNSAGHSKGVDNDHNVNAFNPLTSKSVGPHEWNHGTTDHATFFTRYESGKIQLCAKITGNRSMLNTFSSPEYKCH